MKFREIVRPRLALFWMLGCGALLTGCGTFSSSSPQFHQVLRDTAGQNGRACVRQSDIRGYGVLERDVVSIDGRRNYYLATLQPGCNALSTSPRALFEGRFSEVCGGGRSRLKVGGDTCTFRQIFEFDNRDAAFEAHQQALETFQQLREEDSE